MYSRIPGAVTVTTVVVFATAGSSVNVTEPFRAVFFASAPPSTLTAVALLRAVTGTSACETTLSNSSVTWTVTETVSFGPTVTLLRSRTNLAGSAERTVTLVTLRESVVSPSEASMRVVVAFCGSRNSNQTTPFSVGVDAVGRHDPDVVVMDVIMPGMNGIDAVARIREDGISTPVVMCTTVSQTEKMKRAIVAGADDYVEKPYDSEDVTRTIESVLNDGTSTG